MRGWEAHTYMHLTYDIDESAHRGTREIISLRPCLRSELKIYDGELVLEVPNEQYGDALYIHTSAYQDYRRIVSDAGACSVRPS